MLQIKPIPHYTQTDGAVMKQCAEELRSVFVPQLKLSLPMHHLAGFKHNDIIDYVAEWKKEYPFFLHAEIEKFYPGVNACDLITMLPMAYCDLFGVEDVPENFNDRVISKLVAWAEALPQQGIPFGNNISSILAPLGLLPVWLKIKKESDVKLIVFMDDVFVLCKDKATARIVWHFLTDWLERNLKLQLNIDKTMLGRFLAWK